MEDELTEMIVPVMMMAMLVAMAQIFIPAQPPVEPTPGAAFTCPYCGQGFNTLEELVSHVASMHPDEPPILPIDITWQ